MKITPSALASQLSGSAAGLTFRKVGRPGRTPLTVIAVYPTAAPTGTPSQAQLDNRATFTALAAEWMALPNEERQHYIAHADAARITPIDAYFQLNWPGSALQPLADLDIVQDGTDPRLYITWTPQTVPNAVTEAQTRLFDGNAQQWSNWTADANASGRLTTDTPTYSDTLDAYPTTTLAECRIRVTRPHSPPSDWTTDQCSISLAPELLTQADPVWTNLFWYPGSGFDLYWATSPEPVGYAQIYYHVWQMQGGEPGNWDIAFCGTQIYASSGHAWFQYMTYDSFARFAIYFQADGYYDTNWAYSQELTHE
ncbi:MAG: hypothetical protein PHE72_14595 [candidate division Zixibacteria bacterium]|nr:hypothetical protein [candidate division Zixibacteria bacterium]